MDPISQGVLGTLAAQTQAGKSNLAKAAIIGALSGMAADLDVLIYSSTDPLLALEYHRHFSHSLVFIPIGGLICALILHPLLAKRWGIKFQLCLLWCLLGYATHALLDSCTSYGTQLFWPFSNTRVAWDSISIIDPVFTLPLLALTFLAAISKKRHFVFAAIIWATTYLSLGFIQHQRAIQAGYALAQSRGHQVEQLDSKPSFGNLLVWKVIYEAQGRFYVDAVKPGFKQSVIWQGNSVAKLNIERDLPWLNRHSQQAKDIQRFSAFSAGFITLDEKNPYRIVDMRYSLLPQQIQPLWGIALSPDATTTEHATFYSEHVDSKKSLRALWSMMSQ